jgi:hypothetical protein
LNSGLLRVGKLNWVDDALHRKSRTPRETAGDFRFPDDIGAAAAQLIPAGTGSPRCRGSLQKCVRSRRQAIYSDRFASRLKELASICPFGANRRHMQRSKLHSIGSPARASRIGGTSKGIRATVRFLRRHEHGRGQAPSFGGVAETFDARNRGARVQAMDI